MLKDKQILVFYNEKAGSHYDKTKWAYSKKQDLLKAGYSLVKAVYGKKLIKVNDDGTYTWDDKFNPIWNTFIFEK
mgnify:FL=1|jgi:hypothetical protein